jgi:hypothetical protein
MTPNPLAGTAAGRTSEFIDMMQVVLIRKSGAAQLWRR